MLASALFAGAAAGLLAALLHFAFIQQLILLGEEYETGATVHFQGVAAPAAQDHGTPEPAAEGHGHDHGTADGHSHDAAATDHAHDAADAHAADGHSHGEGEEVSAFTRNGLTVLFSGVIYVGYAFLLIAGFALATQFGHRISAREGLIWGIAGYATFQLAPAMGLSPELPGSVAAELAARQVWWAGTAIATAAGLAALAYGRSPLLWVAGLALVAAPHLIGAPLPEGFHGVAPPEVSATFAARTLGVGLAVWAALGWLAGRFWSRDAALV